MESEAPIFEAYLAMAQDVLMRTFNYACGCAKPRDFLFKLDDLLLDFSRVIDDELDKNESEDNEHGETI